MFLSEDVYISEEQERKFTSLLDRRLESEPVSKIIGKRGFWKFDFNVNEYVLDPRADSETLVEVALKYASEIDVKRIVDFGVGSGCLLLSVLSELQDACGIGVDISVEAIKVAEENAVICGVKDKAGFLNKSWNDDDFISFIGEGYDMIISNPPYIKSIDYDNLSKEVKIYDPKIALYGGDNGLEAYYELAPIFSKVINKNGVVILEIGIGQTGDVIDIFSAYRFVLVDKIKDLGGVCRCLVFKNNPER